MPETIILTILHNNQEHQIPAQIEPRGYTYRVLVHLQDQPVYFEPDEEGMFRALTETPGQYSSNDKELLRQIADLLNEALG